MEMQFDQCYAVKYALEHKVNAGRSCTMQLKIEDWDIVQRPVTALRVSSVKSGIVTLQRDVQKVDKDKL